MSERAQNSPLSGLRFPPPRLSRIRIVGDDPAALDAIAGMLHLRLGHIVLETYTSSSDAFARLRVQAFDTLITDVNRTASNGLQLVSRIKQARPEIPTVILSDSVGQPTATETLSAGAVVVISKPVDREDVILTVRRTLQIAKLRSIMARQERVIKRCLRIYMRVVDELYEQLDNSNDVSDREGLTKGETFSVPIVSHDAIQRQQGVEHVIKMAAERAGQRLTSIDQLFQKAKRTQSETAARLTTVYRELDANAHRNSQKCSHRITAKPVDV